MSPTAPGALESEDLNASIAVVQVNRFLQQQGMRKEEVEREMERAYEQYFSSLARKVRRNSFPIFLIGKSTRKPFFMKNYSRLP